MNNEVTVLQLMHTSGLGTKTLSKILSYYNSINTNTNNLLSEYIPEFSDKLKIKPSMISDMDSQKDTAHALFEELDRHNIKIIIRGSSKYPSRLIDILGEYTPPVLFVRGNLDLLGEKTVGFCGSRKASEKALFITEKCVSKLVDSDITIISGYAQGVDMTAHNTALLHNGNTIFVLATGILNFKWKSTVYQHISDGNSLIISEFLPKFGWNAGNAMQRNSTICGLSAAMVLVESGISGGTFEAGKTALRFGVPLFVVEYAESNSSTKGNEYFLTNGAHAIRGNANREPNLENLLNKISNESSKTAQKSFFDKS